MNKIITTIISLAMLGTPCINLSARHGGDVAGGVAAGLVGGALISGIASSNASRSSRAEEEARRAQDKTELLRQDQERERLAELKREMDRQQLSQQSGNTTMMFGFLIALLFLGLLGLGVLILRKK